LEKRDEQVKKKKIEAFGVFLGIMCKFAYVKKFKIINLYLNLCILYY
jgi:hypothetical protein